MLESKAVFLIFSSGIMLDDIRRWDLFVAINSVHWNDQIHDVFSGFANGS